MNELKKQRKELNNKIRMLDRSDQNTIGGILRYLNKYDFSKSDFIVIEEDLYRIAIESRENKSDISKTITNPKAYCDDLIIKYNRKKYTFIHYLEIFPHDLFIMFSLLLLMYEGTRSIQYGISTNTDILIVRFSFFRYFIGILYLIITRIILDQIFEFREKQFKFYTSLLSIFFYFIISIPIYNPAFSFEVIRFDSKFILWLTILFGIISIYRHIIKRLLKKQP